MESNDFYPSYKIEDLGIGSFSLVENFIRNSGLIFDGFVGGKGDSLDLLRDKLLRNKAKIFIIYVENEIVSYSVLFSKRSTISKTSYDWHLAYVYVDATIRRKKVGEKMLRFLINFASKTKANEISLYASDDNLPAIQLYRKLGFQEHKFIANYIWFKLNLNLFRKLTGT